MRRTKRRGTRGNSAKRSSGRGGAGTSGRKEPMIAATYGLHRVAETGDIVLNSHVRDSGGKVIFENPILCSQFLRDYVNLPYLKEVRPEDIEDVSAQYVPLFAEERNSDRVKRVHIAGGETPFFLVSLIEHKTAPDYNVCMQVFRYMVYIWEAYEKEAEAVQKGVSKRKGFLYPPVLPIVYYEGSGQWDVPLDFLSRIREGSVFGRYLPDFEYYLVPLRDFSNEALLERKDEISLVMMINKLQTAEDIENFRKLPKHKLEAILRDAPDHLVGVIADVLRAFLLKMNVPVSEMEKLTDKVREKKMDELFANMEKMDIQAERRNTDRANKRADEAEKRAEEAEKRADEERERADEERERADEAEKRAALAEENSIRQLVELSQKLGASMEVAVQNLMEQKSLSQEEALEKAGLYWKG